jgi:hypothetical protein
MIVCFHAVSGGIVGTVGKAELRNEKREAIAGNELETSTGFIREAVYLATL